METLPDREVDARGSNCPGPLMELIATIRESPRGTVISLLSTEPGSCTDVPTWLHNAGHTLLSFEELGDHWRFVFRVER